MAREGRKVGGEERRMGVKDNRIIIIETRF